jgi:hypothetical protein
MKKLSALLGQPLAAAMFQVPHEITLGLAEFIRSHGFTLLRRRYDLGERGRRAAATLREPDNAAFTSIFFAACDFSGVTSSRAFELLHALENTVPTPVQQTEQRM